MTRETKTVLICVTTTPNGLIVQGAAGSPTIAPLNDEMELGRAVTEIVNDPSQPSHALEAAGFNMQDVFRGVGRFLEGMGKDEGSS